MAQASDKTVEILDRRHGLLGPTFSTFCQESVRLVKGSGVMVWNAHGPQLI
ncbi:MAG: hypothetical protein GY947_02555 [Rhodobacteraceae bacterium]|nr:hypothetical protein [Paracoccaceae bacterium]